MVSYQMNSACQPAAETSKPARPRICLPTSRNITKRAFQCGLYEAQDVLVDTDDVDLICLEAGPGLRGKERWQRRLLYRDISKKLIFFNPGVHKVRLTREYELFLAVCQNYWDLLYLNAIDGWKDQCKASVCWLDEMWAADIPQHKYWLHTLNRFDHIFVGYSGTVAPLSEALGRSCRWLPGAVDALRFTPYPNPPARVIDVYSIGRRRDGIHRALLQAAERQEMFYIYDTFRGADLEPTDHRQHRELVAHLAKRSWFFTVAPGKMDAPDQTHGQVEIGYRYFEGAAAGAVMVGQAPNCEAFRQTFHWPGAVIELQPDGSDAIKVLASLRSDPTRVSAISRRNAAEVLLHHDWVYRWKEIVRVAGIEPSPSMVARECRLKDLVDLAAPTA